MSDLETTQTNSLAASDNAAPASPATPGTPAAPATATPNAGAAPVTSGGAPQVEPSWLKQRLDETRASTAKQLNAQFRDYVASQESRYNSEIERLNNQIRAVLGVTPPQNPEIDQVRTQFSNIYPGLSKMEEKAQAIIQLLERAQDFDAQTDHYWETYTRQTVNDIFKRAEEAYGNPLTDTAKRNLYAAFRGYVESNPEVQARYGKDPSVIDEFWKDFTSSFIDPVRRTASAQTQVRAGAVSNLPQNDPTGGLKTSSAPKLTSLDERVAAALELYKQKANIGG